jgi:S-formylglutathione hydrolase FrmB
MSMRHSFMKSSACAFLFISLALVCISLPATAQGRIDCSRIDSHLLHQAIRYCVMLPASYETQKTQKYPVLYFLHGLGQNEQALMEGGGWGMIQDMRQRHEIGDFLVVAVEGQAGFFINSADGKFPYSDFFTKEFMLFVESHYRIKRGRAFRGVSGLSMGGYGALRFAFAYPDLFSSVSAQSPALITQAPKELNRDLNTGGPIARLLGRVFGNPINLAHWEANNPFVLARKNRIQLKRQSIYFNCGQEDEYGFADGAQKLHKQLVVEGVPHEFHLYPGGHDADYFLSHLGETLQFHWRAFSSAGKPVR